MMKAKQRLYLTASKTALVAQGDRRAATLYCTPGDEIPDSAAERFGLVDGALPDGDDDAADLGLHTADLPEPGEVLRISIIEGAILADASLGLDFKPGELTTVREGEISEADLLAMLKEPALRVEAALVGDPSPGWVEFPGRELAIEALQTHVDYDLANGRAHDRVGGPATAHPVSEVGTPALQAKEAAPAPNKEAPQSPNKEAAPPPTKAPQPAEKKAAAPKRGAKPKKAAVA